MKSRRNQKSSPSPPEDRRGGARPGAGRPKLPRVTVTLPQNLYDFLTGMAEADGRPPDEYSAELLATTIRRLMADTADPDQWPEPEPPQLRELEIGQALPVLKNHVNIVWKLRRGGTLREVAPGRWELAYKEKIEPIDGRTIASLLRRGVTVVRED